MIYKIKIRNKTTGDEDFIIMGDSYKNFTDHFQDVISHWTNKWHYADEGRHSECFGRTINKEVLEIWYSKDRFVSFGGLKMCYEENYDEEVEEHNKSGIYKPCKKLGEIKWLLEDKNFIRCLLKNHKVISGEELKECVLKQDGEKK